MDSKKAALPIAAKIGIIIVIVLFVFVLFSFILGNIILFSGRNYLDRSTLKFCCEDCIMAHESSLNNNFQEDCLNYTNETMCVNIFAKEKRTVENCKNI
ncbi:MAG: hypothetical protein V1859_06570 [archaeon]